MPELLEFRYPSARSGHTIYAQELCPDTPPRAVIQIVHGVAEHMGRYEEVSRFLAAHGFLVCGEDHLGHGKTVEDGSYGFFAPKGGWDLVVRDVRRLRELEGEKYPSLPYFLLGHSMGSFLTRTYLIQYPGTLDGVILSGTGQEPAPLVALGRALASLECRRLGLQGFAPWWTPSPWGPTTAASAPTAPAPTGSPATRRRWTPIWPTPSAAPSPPCPCSGT